MPTPVIIDALRTLIACLERCAKMILQCSYLGSTFTKFDD